MSPKLPLLIAILTTASTSLLAQRGGMAGGGRGVAPHATSTARPSSPRNSDRPSRRRSDFGDYGGYSDLGWPYPDNYGDYWDSSLYGRENSYLLGQGIPYMPPAEPVSPPPPVEPVVHEYSWPESASGSATAFTIVSKDGTVHRAIAVWVQDGSLCFTTPRGTGGQLALNDVDSTATNRINAELNLKLPMLFPDQDGPVNRSANVR